MRNIRRRTIAGAAIAAFALIAAACGSGGDGGTIEGPTITIGSANFSENALVAEIYAQALEADGYQVERKLNVGNREIYEPALESGELDLVPEYIGTMLTFLGGAASSDSDETHAALRVALEPKGLTVLDYAAAQDKNGFVVTRATADELGVAKVSDLAAFNGTLVLGGPPECPERAFCLKGLEDVYGLSFQEFRPLDAGGPITVAALEGDEIQVGLMFTSDGTILAKDFVLLEDDNFNAVANFISLVESGNYNDKEIFASIQLALLGGGKFDAGVGDLDYSIETKCERGILRGTLAYLKEDASRLLIFKHHADKANLQQTLRIEPVPFGYIVGDGLDVIDNLGVGARIKEIRITAKRKGSKYEPVKKKEDDMPQFGGGGMSPQPGMPTMPSGR